MSQINVARRTRQAAVASALFLALGAAAYAHGPGHGHRGHGAHNHGAGFERVIAHAKEKLALDTSQQQMFDNTVALTRSAREAGRAEIAKLKDATRAELAKPAPDLAALAAIADSAQAQGQEIRRQVRDEWLKLYATFSPEQKTVVRDILAKRLERQDRMRDGMKRAPKQG
jgi:Spy/CpxP family protein refolding chaperone